MIVPRLALRTLRREWRLPELRTLIAALLLSVIALGAVGTLATRVQRAVLMSAADRARLDGERQAAYRVLVCCGRRELGRHLWCRMRVGALRWSQLRALDLAASTSPASPVVCSARHCDHQ